MRAILAVFLCGLLVLPRISRSRSRLTTRAFAVKDRPPQQQSSRHKRYPTLGVDSFGERVVVLRSEPPVWLVRDVVNASDREALIRLGRNELRREVTYTGSVVVFDEERVWPLYLVPFLSAAFQYVFRGGDLAATIVGFIGAALAAVALKTLIAWLFESGVATGGRGGARFQGKKWQLVPFQEKDAELGDDACFRLLKRVQALTGAPSLQHLEPPLLTRYREGDGQSVHIDSHERPGPDADAEALQSFRAKGGQRIVQCLVYLNSVSEEAGGATKFHHPSLEDLRVQPEAGSALLFCTTFADGVEDARLSHSAENVRGSTSEKWVLPLWRCEGEHSGWQQSAA